MEVVVESCVCGYHVNQAVRVPVIGKHLNFKREMGNAEDRHAVAVVNWRIKWLAMCHGQFHACAPHLSDEVVSYTVLWKEQDDI